jgi:hypothetical protein
MYKSEVRIKCAVWYCVVITNAQTLVIQESPTSQVENKAVVYQSKDKRAAENHCVALSLSTGLLYCKPCAPPAVNGRGLAIDHDRQSANAHKAIRPTIRAAYPWERI